MEDRENFRALASMFALSRLAYIHQTQHPNEEHNKEIAAHVAKHAVMFADALLDELEPTEGIVALKKRKKNVSE